MSLPRFYQQSPLVIEQTVQLDEAVFGHAIRVLRLPLGEQIILFNGDGHDYICELTNIAKKQAQVKVQTQLEVKNESQVHIHLGQGISRGDRMDFVLQKSVELGVDEITPLFTERCGVKLSGERLDKKVQQWQKIVNSACEQSGRAVVPKVNQPIWLQEWQQQAFTGLKLQLHPKASSSIKQLEKPQQAIKLVIGPEGGLTEKEINELQLAGFNSVLMGPRILRTETAALTALSILQSHFGDI